jgi:hypothetical protein
MKLQFEAGGLEAVWTVTGANPCSRLKNLESVGNGDSSKNKTKVPAQ